MLADSWALSLSTAAIIAASVLAAAYWLLLPLFAGAAVYLFLAVLYDVRTLRIPNWLNLTALGSAVLAAWLAGGVPALAGTLAGAALGLAIGFALFASGGLGAGDAKGLMVLGAFFGSVELLGVLAWVLLVGGVLAAAGLALLGELPELLRRWGRDLQTLVATGRFERLKPPRDSMAAGGVPFAIPMGLGTALQLIWGSPWL